MSGSWEGEDWTYGFYCEGSGESAPNGPVAWTENPLGQRASYGWDWHRNKTLYRDALNHEWTYAYDDNGNMLSATDPLDHVQSWTYDEFNNVTSMTDAENNTVSLVYDKPGYPTLLTERIDPPDGQGSNEARTYFDYYLTTEGDPSSKHGLVKQVTDPNGVIT